MAQALVLTLSCEDRPGITARVAGCLFDHGGNILEAQQFNDQEHGEFFMRVEFDPGAGEPETFARGFEPLAQEFGIDWHLRGKDAPRRVVIMVSKFDHCLGDLLYRTRIGELPMEIVVVIGNHPRSALSISDLGDVPYHHLPVTAGTKPAQEAQVRQIIED